MKTQFISAKQLQERWFLIDASGQTLGRLASKIAPLLQGKDQPHYSPNLNCGARVVVINSEKVTLTSNKAERKVYRHHTGYIGHLKEQKFSEVMHKHPTRPLEKAIKGMLPKNKLGRQQLANLYVYAGSEHRHQAQKPIPRSL